MDLARVFKCKYEYSNDYISPDFNTRIGTGAAVTLRDSEVGKHLLESWSICQLLKPSDSQPHV